MCIHLSFIILHVSFTCISNDYMQNVYKENVIERWKSNGIFLEQEEEKKRESWIVIRERSIKLIAPFFKRAQI